MERLYWILISMLSVSACALTQLDGSGGSSRKGGEQHSDDDNPDGYVYYAAVMEPDHLALIAGNEIRVELDDRDSWTSHFIVRGHLYDDTHSNGHTLVRRDGRPVLQWEGEEMVWDMAISDRDTLCLCTRLDGSSMCLRRNGVVAKSYEGCWPLSGFYVDEGQLCFDIGGQMTGFIRGEEEHLWDSAGFTDVADLHILSAGGVPWLVGNWTNVFSYSLAGPMDSGLEAVPSEVERYLGVLHDDAGTYVEDSRGGVYRILKDWTVLYSSEVPFDRRAVAVEGDDIRSLGRLEDGTWAVFREGTLTPLPDGCKPYTGGGLALHGGRLMFPVIMSDGNAGIWDNGKVSGLGFKGYVDHVVIGRGSSDKVYLSW